MASCSSADDHDHGHEDAVEQTHTTSALSPPTTAMPNLPGMVYDPVRGRYFKAPSVGKSLHDPFGVSHIPRPLPCAPTPPSPPKSSNKRPRRALSLALSLGVGVGTDIVPQHPSSSLEALRVVHPLRRAEGTRRVVDETNDYERCDLDERVLELKYSVWPCKERVRMIRKDLLLAQEQGNGNVTVAENTIRLYADCHHRRNGNGNGNIDCVAIVNVGAQTVHVRAVDRLCVTQNRQRRPAVDVDVGVDNEPGIAAICVNDEDGQCESINLAWTSWSLNSTTGFAATPARRRRKRTGSQSHSHRVTVHSRQLPCGMNRSGPGSGSESVSNSNDYIWRRNDTILSSSEVTALHWPSAQSLMYGTRSGLVGLIDVRTTSTNDNDMASISTSISTRHQSPASDDNKPPCYATFNTGGHVIDMKSPEVTNPHHVTISAVDNNNNGKGKGNGLCTWDLRMCDGDEPCVTFDGHVNQYKRHTFDARAGVVAAPGHDKVVRVWDATLGGNPLVALPFDSFVAGVVIGTTDARGGRGGGAGEWKGGLFVQTETKGFVCGI